MWIFEFWSFLMWILMILVFFISVTAVGRLTRQWMHPGVVLSYFILFFVI